MYDSLMYVKKLEAVGVPRNQAEAQVEIMSQIIDSNFATKQDISELRHDMNAVSAELRHEMASLSLAMKQDMTSLTADLKLEIKDATLRFGKMLTATAGIIIAAVALLLKL